MKKIRIKSLKTRFAKIDVYTQSMKVKDVVGLTYVAIRGRDTEEGAVQRVLNKQRIELIKNFVLKGEIFFNTFILNWTYKKLKPRFKNNYITIPLVKDAAQVIDGQHRLVGLESALEIDSKIGEREILVTISLDLKTSEAASIFLNINSEQKPVPRSLIYDLFGEIDDDMDHAINRAKDIAIALNENKDSPYFGYIKFPGTAIGVGSIDLATIVGSLRKHLEPEGIFANNKIYNLNIQKSIIINYFSAIKDYYEKEGIWHNKKVNPFIKNAGFYGAIEFFTSTLFNKCVEKKSFEVNFIKSVLNLKPPLIEQKDIKKLEGKSQRKEIVNFLNSNVSKTLPDEGDYKV